MIELYGELGLNVDGKYHNVALVHTEVLDKPFGGTGIPFYGDDRVGLTLGYELDIPAHINHPIVGVTAKDGVGVAQVTYSTRGQRKARVYIGFCEYRHGGELVGRHNAEQVVRELGIKAYIYDINPQGKRSKYGLQVYGEQGDLLFSSDFNPLKIGVNGDTNDGNHVLFTQTFCDYVWYERGTVRWEHTLREGEIRTPVMLDTVYQGRAMKFERYIQDVLDIPLSGGGDFWVKSFERVNLNYHLPIIGHILC